MGTFEDWILTASKEKLFLRGWTPPNPRGAVLITHGQAEHSGCYSFLVQCLTGAGYSVWAWDLRGHGKSDGKRGYVANFDDYIQDFIDVFKFVRSQLPAGQGLVALSHSMGGLIQTKALMENTDLQLSLKAQVLSSPLFGLALKVPYLKDRAAIILSRLAPKITLFNEINFSILTHDSQVLAAYPSDPLRHDQVSPSVYVGMIEAFKELPKGGSLIRLPTLLQQAGSDRVVSRSAAEKIYAGFAATDKEIRIYEGLFHEIYNEVGRQQVFEDLLQFLAKRM